MPCMKKVFGDLPKCGGAISEPHAKPHPCSCPCPGLSHIQPLPLVLPLGPATGELNQNDDYRNHLGQLSPPASHLKDQQTQVPSRDHGPGTGRRVGLERIVGHVTSMEKCPRYKLSKGRRGRAGERPGGGRRGQGGPGGKASHHPADERLHHEGVLKVTDGIAVLGPTFVDPWEEKGSPS